MYLRKLWLIIAVLGAMASPLSFGLGLGEITLNSNLNQPLDAEIKLLQVRDLTREEIFAQLGSGEDFRRRGVERIFFLQDIRFEVQLDNPSGPIVKLTSQKPVVEPFLIFIIQLEWPSGRAQREYTLLMDLPVFTDRPVEPVQGVQTQPRVQSPPPAPPVQQAQPRPQPAPVTQPAPAPQRTTPPPPLPTRQDPPPPVQPQASTPAPAPAPAPQPLNPSLQSGESYTVRENDTLWEIALSTRPNRGVSVQQTMLALQRLNPEAFINGNINLLKEGQVLRIPDQSEIQQLDQQSAVSEVAFQNTQWSGNPDGIVSGAELQGSRVTDNTSTANDDRRGQLTLASPSDPTRASGDRSGSGLSASERDALENDLAISLEQLDSSQRENAELSERVEELEEQITTMERLIEVSNEEMRTLQLALEQNADVSIELPDNLTDAVDSELSDNTISDDLVIEETTDLADTDSANNVDAATETPAASVQPPPVAPPVVPARRDPSIVDMLMDYIWYIGAAILALLLAGVYMWHRKTQAEMESFDDFDEEFEGDGEMEFAQDDYDEEPVDESELDLDDNQEIEEEEPEPVAPTEAQTGDAVGEADIYIAYGKYDQAEEMLKKAIVNEPNNVDARVKLLEVYSETSNATKFDQEYGKLLALGDATANEKAADLRSAIPGIAAYQVVADTLDQFEEPTDFAPTNEVEETDSLDLNFDLAEDDLAETEEPESDGIDFDLGDIEEPELDLSENVTASNPALADDQIEAAKDEDDFDLTDFSLDLDDEEGEATSALDSDDEELTLDLDDDDQGSEELSLSDTDEDGELSLDLEEDDDLSFDLDMDEEEFDKEFDSVMTEEAEEIKPAADPSVNETLSRDFDAGIDFDSGVDDKEEPIAKDDDILSDLEFSAATLASEEDAKEALNESASQHAKSDSASNDDDDFDLDMGDVDLAALDEEMDALVGDIDDIDDDDVAVSPTEVVQAVTDSDVDDIEVDLDTDEPEISASESLVSSDDAEMDEDAELDFLADTDEVATKLDLARAYIDMGDKDGAKDILSEVVSEGDDDQKKEAQELLGKIT